MATSGPTDLISFFNTDAEFRTWISSIHSAITGLGLVNTSDTGQVDTSTVAKPAGASTFQGYKVYRFDDALQATVPVFIKLEFGSGGITGRPALKMTVGTSTNGAGTITGQAGTFMSWSHGVTDAAGTYKPMLASGDTGRLSLLVNLNPSLNSAAMFFHVERPKDGTGTATADGIITYGCNNGNVAFQVIPASGSVPTANTTPPAGFMALPGHHTKGGSRVFLDQMRCAIGGKAVYATLLSYLQADLGELVAFSASVYGATHTLMPLGDGLYQPAGTNTSAAILWE